MTVWKYELALTDTQDVLMPIGAKPLTVAFQGKTLCLWALVQNISIKSLHRFHIRGTGHPIVDFDAEDAIFIGTVFVDAMVFHVWMDRTQIER